MSLYVPNEVTDLYVNAGGTAKQVTTLYANADGVAKLVYELNTREYPYYSGSDVMLSDIVNKSSYSEFTQTADFELQAGDTYEIYLLITFKPPINASNFDEVEYFLSDVYLDTSAGSSSGQLSGSYSYPTSDSAQTPSIRYTASGSVSSAAAGNNLSYTFSMSSGSYNGTKDGETKSGSPIVDSVEFYIEINGNEIFGI